MARFGAVPRLPKIANTWFCSTSCCVAGTVFDGSYASSRTVKLILRLLTPPWSLTYAKYALSAAGIVLYSEATPVGGNVPPRSIEVDVMPGSARCAPEAAEAATAAISASPTRTATSLPFLPINPPRPRWTTEYDVLAFDLIAGLNRQSSPC